LGQSTKGFAMCEPSVFETSEEIWSNSRQGMLEMLE
jgi:hypothetical protein